MGCWDPVEKLYSNDINNDRICKVYNQLRESHPLTITTYGRGSWEELELRYCDVFHLCYRLKEKLDEAVSFIAELLEVLKSSFHLD